MSHVGLEQAATAATSPLGELEAPIERAIEPRKRRLRVRDLVREAPVIRVLAARDFKVKYKQSLLGPIWLIFQPLALLGAFFVAFRNLAGVETSGVPYLVFALVGVTVWAFFQAAMTIGTASLITNYHLVRLTPCPRPAFPLASLIASLPALAVGGVCALAAAAISGTLSPRVVLLPIAIAWLCLFTAGLVAISSALTVRFRDVMNGLPFLMQIGVFISPVGYPTSALGPTVARLVELNPLTGIIETWRWVMLDTAAPGLFPFVVAIVGTALVSVFGWRLFARLEVTMADDI